MADNVLPFRIPRPGRPGEFFDMSRVDPSEPQLVNVYLLRGYDLETARAAARAFVAAGGDEPDEEYPGERAHYERVANLKEEGEELYR